MLHRAYITVVGPLAAAALLSVVGASAESRIWTSANGAFKIDAELVEARPNGALILKKPDGQMLQVDVAKLSAADQQFVRGLKANGARLQPQPQLPQPPALAAPSRKLRPVPDAAAATAKLKEVREILDTDYRQAESKPHGGQQLYDKLMELAQSSLAADPVGAYVTAKEASVVAAVDGDVEKAAASITWLAEQFEIGDAIARKADLVQKIKIDSLAVDALPDVVEKLLSLMDETQDAADYERSMEIGRVAAQVAHKSRDKDLIALIKARGTALKAQREIYEAVAAARKTLAESPQDKEANLCLGRFLALVHGKWDVGLPRLSAGGNTELAALAKHDLARPAGGKEQLALADAWWNLSQSTAYAQLPQIKGRAAYWYKQSAPQLVALEKLRAEKRIAEINAALAESQKSSGGLAAGSARREVKTNSIGMKLSLIPAGEFLMGSPETEVGRRGDEQQHRVRITRPFYMGIYTVTQAEYKRVMGSIPYPLGVKGQDPNRLPIKDISWDDAQEFCRKLSQKENKHYRLPTEAEWEYACRAGTTTAYNVGRSLPRDKANILHSGLSNPTKVGAYRPNAFGLYDMHGNVSQWCSDWYDGHYYEASPVDDPQGPEAGGQHVHRGGCFAHDADQARSSCRWRDGLTYLSPTVGFRVVCER